jgi:hypothetical protein
MPHALLKPFQSLVFSIFWFFPSSCKCVQRDSYSAKIFLLWFVICQIQTHFRSTKLLPYFLIIKSTRCTKFSNLFWNETLHVSDSSSVYHQEFFTVHTAMVYAIHFMLSAWEQDQDGNAVLSWTYSQDVYKPVWHIPLSEYTVKNSWWWTEELSETCNVSFQNKFENLVHLVGSIVRKFVTMHSYMNIEYSHILFSWNVSYISWNEYI